MPIAGKIIIITIAMFVFTDMAFSQIPVEVFGGHKKSTLDILFFKYFKNRSGTNSKFLFFNRNRASVDYQMSSTTNLPQFGFTEAISYNHPKLKGFAPVIVGQIFNSGVFPKAGIQYVHIEKNITLFSWLVTETMNNPRIDLFFLGRYTPRINEKLNLFNQVELVNTAPTSFQKNYYFIQRLRIGLKIKEFQFGFATDLSQTGRNQYITSHNVGGFLRYEY